MFDLRDLRYFEVIASTGHLGRAAEKLGRTQPALSKSVRRLEEAVGATLFARSGRNLRLTPVGDMLLARARDAQASLRELAREVTDFAQGSVGLVRIGAGATTAEYLLPKVCGALLAQFPQVRIEIVIGMNDVLRTSLREGVLDIVAGPIIGGDDQDFAIEPFGVDEVVAVAGGHHPLATENVRLADLAGHRWVLPARSVETRRWLTDTFERHDLPCPVVQIETNNISLLPQLIAETGLLSFISRRHLGAFRAGSRLRELGIAELTMKRRLGLIHRRASYLSPAATRMIEAFRQHGQPIWADVALAG